MMKFAGCKKYKNCNKIFSDYEIEEIHNTTLRILEEVGVKILDEKTLKLFDSNGANVDYDKKTVKIGRELVSACLGKTPPAFSLYNQDYVEMRIGEEDFYVVSMVEEAYIIDGSTHKRRETTLEDVKKTIRLIDQLPYYHICCNPVIAHDVEPKLSIIYSAAQIYKNTAKNCLVVPSTGQEARFIIELGAAVAGSEKKLIEKPVLSVTIAPSSPLKLPKNICEVIWEYASRNLPIIIVHAPLAGATSPVTIAGTMAMANAESLATLTLIQLINPGNSIGYGGAAVKFDMKTGFPAYGTIEYGILSTATAQLAKYYKLPAYGAGGATNANLSDAQSGYEKMSSTLLGYMAGHDILCDAGLNANGLISLDAMVIQDEIFAEVTRLSKKVQVNDESLAFDTIKRVMEGSDFLLEEHTLNNLHKDFVYSEVGNHKKYEEWVLEGGKDSIQKNTELADKILSGYEPHKLGDEKIKRIDEILKLAKDEII